MAFKIKQKLNSQTGASITFALLLFLVCAVISSIVLTAGTAASGRMSKMVDRDQSYYAVTSAAELLKEMMTAETVTVENTVVSTEKRDQSGTILSTENPVIKSDISDFKVNGTSKGSLTIDHSSTPETTTLSSNDIIKQSFAVDAVYQMITSTKLEKELKLTAEGKNLLDVDINEKINPENGDIEFVIEHKRQEMENGKTYDRSYKMTLLFTADISESSGEKIVNGPREDISADGKSFNYTTTITRTTNTSYKWNLASMKTYY